MPTNWGRRQYPDKHRWLSRIPGGFESYSIRESIRESNRPSFEPPDEGLSPIFGCKAFGADTECDDVHHGPIPEGDWSCCMVCNKSGQDGTAYVDKKKPGDGQMREGFEHLAAPTKYPPPKLRGGK